MCDCDETAWDSEGLCIRVSLPDSTLAGLDSLFGDLLDLEELGDFVTWVPSECYAECWGYTDYETLDCDSIWNDDWEWDEWEWDDDWEWDDPFDCECDESDWDEEGICISVTKLDSVLDATGNVVVDTSSFVTWAPSVCYAECWGYSEFELIDCDSIWNDDWEWDEWEWDDPNDCECDESDWDGEGICITVSGFDSLLTGTGWVLDSLDFETWVPSECYAECWGITDYEIIDCDSIWNDDWEWDDEWEDPYDCECDESDWEGEGICIIVSGFDSLLTGTGWVMDSLDFETWIPSECYAECWGITDYEIIDCDSIWNDDWEWDDEWDDPFDCECEESDWEGEGICIIVSELDSFLTGSGSVVLDSIIFETWVPSECYAECWGFADFEIIDCDSLSGTGIFGWDECDCEYDLDDEPVCVLTDAITGEICPFPNMCFAECAGYTEDDVVDCETTMDFECLECMEEEIDPVCVVDASGFVFPVPNSCFADCLGLDVVDDAACGEFTQGENNDDLVITPYEHHTLRDAFDEELNSFNVYPNPVSDIINIELDFSVETDITVSLISAEGSLVNKKNFRASKGYQKIGLDLSELTPGMYMIQLNSSRQILTERILKM